MNRMIGIFIVSVLTISPAVASVVKVTVDTSPLIGNAAGPYRLDFQLTDGSGTGAGNTSITLSQFEFGAGAGGNVSRAGSAAGSFASGFTLTTTQFFNEVNAAFTPGASLSFLVSVNASRYSTPFPDGFSFSILDGTGVEIPTRSPFNVFVFVELRDSNSTFQSFAAPDYRIAAPSVTPISSPVPEPSTPLLMLALPLAWVFWSRFALPSGLLKS